MDPLYGFLVTGVVAAAFGGGVAAILFCPLRSVVADLCGTRERARFWSAYLCTMLVLAPLLGVAFIATYGARVPDLASLLERSLFFALLGLTAALLAIGIGIARPPRPAVVPGVAEPPQAAG